MTQTDARQLDLQVLVNYPRSGRSNQTYELSVDLKHGGARVWPYDEEEIVLSCRLDTMPLFSHTPLSEPELVVQMAEDVGRGSAHGRPGA